MHATENHHGGPPPVPPVDSLIAVITRALPGSTCSAIESCPPAVECGAPASVAISVDAWAPPLMRCAECWPSLDELLRSREARS